MPKQAKTWFNRRILAVFLAVSEKRVEQGAGIPPGCGVSGGTGPVVSLRSTTGYRLGSLRERFGGTDLPAAAASTARGRERFSF